MSIQGLISAMIGIVVGVALLPVVQDTIDSLDTAGLSPAVTSLVDLLPILFVILIVGGAVAFLPRIGRR